MAKHLTKLKRWLATPGNSESLLALKLGYKTSQTIRQWVLRKRIPGFRLEQVMEIIDGNAGKRHKG